MTTALVSFLLAGGLLAVTPGPDSLLVLRSILRRGRRTAAATVAGILTGLSVWVVAAAIGLSALLRVSHLGYTLLKLAGAVYLVTLGIRTLRTQSAAPEPAGTPRGHHGILGVGYWAGVATNLLNPKVGVFFVTFLPGFVPPGVPVGATSLLFGVVFVAENALYLAVLLLCANRVVSLTAQPTFRRRLDRLTGLVLIGFGARLAVER